MRILPDLNHLKEKLNEIATMASYGAYALDKQDDLLSSIWKGEAHYCELFIKALDDVKDHRLEQWIAECLRFIEDEYHLIPRKIESSKEKVNAISLPLLETHKNSILRHKHVFPFKWSVTIQALASKYKHYWHNNITEEEIGRWLMQFSDDGERYKMLKLLCNVEFFSTEMIGEGFRQYYENLTLNEKMDLRVILLGTQADSMAVMEKLFKDYCGIKGPPVISKSIKDTVRSINNSKPNLLLFIDDLIGSGKQSTDILKEYLGLIEELDYYTDKGLKYIQPSEQLSGTEIQKLKEQKIVYIYCAALNDGYHHLSDFLRAKDFNYEVQLLMIHAPLKKCFDSAYEKSDGNSLFISDAERTEMRSLCEKYGMEIWPDHPLGYKDSQQLVVFSHNSPNNTLPIFWKKGDNWKPLFPRPEER